MKLLLRNLLQNPLPVPYVSPVCEYIRINLGFQLYLNALDGHKTTLTARENWTQSKQSLAVIVCCKLIHLFKGSVTKKGRSK